MALTTFFKIVTGRDLVPLNESSSLIEEEPAAPPVLQWHGHTTKTWHSLFFLPSSTTSYSELRYPHLLQSRRRLIHAWASWIVLIRLRPHHLKGYEVEFIRAFIYELVWILHPGYFTAHY
jgi:hypothetical protein